MEYPTYQPMEPGHREHAQLVDDLGFDCEALEPGPIRPDVHGVIQARGQAQHYQWLAGRARSMAEELRTITDRPPEWYDAQRALLVAADYLTDAAQRMEGGSDE